jgi:hypothetical protein
MKIGKSILALAVSALTQVSALAGEVVFSGGSSGIDPLGNGYSFDGSDFLLSTGSGTFNPLAVAVGSGTTARSFSFKLIGPAVFDPEPVLVPNACPPGQTAIYIHLNPTVITCVSSGSGPHTRYDWPFSRVVGSPGTIRFDAPVGGELVAGKSTFDFSLHFNQPVDAASFSFIGAWSDVSAVPEPASALYLALGLLAVGAAAGRSRLRVQR